MSAIRRRPSPHPSPVNGAREPACACGRGHAKIQTASIILAAHNAPELLSAEASAKADAHSLRSHEKKGAERRETRGRCDPAPAGLRDRRARLRTVRPPLAIEEARLAALHWRHLFRTRATLSWRASAPPSASSWREVRSDLQVEPRAARVRNAFRPRVPHPAPPSRCLAKAPFSEQDTCNRT
jgi:hypothetical protein